MRTYEYQLITLLLLGIVKSSKGTSQRSHSVEKERKNYEPLCNELAKDPYFEADLVIGKPWRIYYMWNMSLENKCVDMTFKVATPKIIRRIFYDMNEYIEEQPAWGAASLLLTMGKSKREMLLFDDQGPVGRILGVPNTIRDGVNPMKMAVPLLKFQMKVSNNNRFLILMDCQIGIVSLAARYDDKLTKEEVKSAASSLFPLLGEGHLACFSDGHKNDDDLLIH